MIGGKQRTNRKRIGVIYKYSIICIPVLILLIVLCGGNNNNPDYIAYQRIFSNEVTIEEGAWLDFLFIQLFRRIGLPYEYYRLTLYTLGLYLLFRATKKMFGNNLLFLILFAIFPMMMDTTQTTNFMCMCFLFYSIYLLNEKESIWPAVIAILLGAGFHFIGYVYLPFIILIRRENLFQKQVFRILLIGALIVSVAFSAFAPVFIHVSLLTTGLFDGRISRYVLNEHTNLGHYYYYMLHCIGMFFVWIANKSISYGNDLYNEKEIDFCNLVFKINVYMILFFPMLHFSGTVFRLWRNIVILDYAAWMIMLRRKEKNTGRYLVKVIAIVGLAIFYFVLLINNGYHNSIVAPFLENFFF